MRRQTATAKRPAATRGSKPPAPLTARAQASSGSPYEAASYTRRTLGWRAPTTSPNNILWSLSTLRDRSRAAVRNDGYAKGTIDKLVTNIIGTGLTPRSQAKDPAFRKLVQQKWLQWTDESDADGLLDFYGQQRQAVRGWLESGEVFNRLRNRLLSDGLSVPLQLQVIEPELCPHTHNMITATARIRAGIEFNGIGRRVAYWFHPSRPEQDDFDASRLNRIPAELVIHLYDPLRAGQLRGIPHLTPALITLLELDKFDDATLIRQQLANLFVAFVTRPAGPSASETLHPLTGQALETDANDKPLIPLEPGIFQELEPGEEVKFSEPPDPKNYRDFTRQLVMRVAAGTGVPYEILTGDMSGLNDRTLRVILHEFRRQIQAWQHQLIAFQFCRPIWKAWMDRAFISGALPLPADYQENPDPWLAVKWSPQSWPYLHPVQDIDAQKAAVRNGFTTRAAIVSEQGDDVEDIDREQAADNARADDLGLTYDSDARVDNASDPTPEPEPEPDPAPVPEPALA